MFLYSILHFICGLFTAWLAYTRVANYGEPAVMGCIAGIMAFLFWPIVWIVLAVLCLVRLFGGQNP